MTARKLYSALDLARQVKQPAISTWVQTMETKTHLGQMGKSWKIHTTEKEDENRNNSGKEMGGE